MHGRWLFILLVTLQATLGSTVSQSIGSPPPGPTYVEHLRSLNRGSVAEREQAARLLGAKPVAVDVTVPTLLKAMLKDREKAVTTSIRSALVTIGKPAVSHILAAMDVWPAERLRELVVVLAVMGVEADAAVPKLQELLEFPDAGLRRSARFALNNIRPGSVTPRRRNQIPDIIETSREKSYPQTTELLTDLEKPAPLTIVDNVDTVPTKQESEEANAPQIVQVAGGNTDNEVHVALAKVESDLPLLKLSPQEPTREFERDEGNPIPQRLAAGKRYQANWYSMTSVLRDGKSLLERGSAKAVSISAAAKRFLTNHRLLLMDAGRWVGLAYAGWLLIFLVVPELFVKSETRLRQSPHSMFKRLILCWILPLRLILLLPWLCRTRYATRGFINSRSEPLMNQFWERPEVRRHSGYASTPMQIDGQYREQMTARDWRRISRHDHAVIQIAGPSGSGKSMLTVEIARLATAGELTGCRLLPVFLSPGSDLSAEIREQVCSLLTIQEEDQTRYESLLQQCEKRYILPIIELSSNGEESVALLDAVRAEAGTAPIVVVAKDAEHQLQTVGHRLEPLVPESERLHLFMREYLACRGNKEEQIEIDLEQLSAHWQDIQTAAPTSLLFLTMFLDEALRCGSDVNWRPPRTVLELLQRHIQSQLTHATGSGFTPDELRRDITELAKMSTAKAFRPQPVRYDAALKRMGGWNAAHRLALLEEQLQLIEIARGDNRVIQFRNDLIAVQLSAAERQVSLDLSGARWNSCLQQLRVAVREAKFDVEPYALALYDCCIASENVRPESVLGELGQLAGLDANQIQHDTLEQHTTACVSLLKSSDQQTRLDTLAELRRLALRSERAVEVLIDVLCDVENDAAASAMASEELVQLGAQTLDQLCERLNIDHSSTKVVLIDQMRRMGPAAQPAVPLILQQLTNGDDLVRAPAVLAIASIAPNEMTQLKDLLRADSVVVRAACVEAFGTLGESAEDMVETISTLLDDDSVQVRLAAVIALGKIGLASVNVVTGMIKATVADEEAVRRAAGVSLAQLRGRPDTSIDLGFERDRGRHGIASTVMARAA